MMAAARTNFIFLLNISKVIYFASTKVVKTNENYFKIRFVKVKTLCIFAPRF
jgi:hypothetical protein